MEKLKLPTRKQMLLGVGTTVAVVLALIRREEPWGYLPTDNLANFNPPPEIMWVTHRDNSPDRILTTSTIQTNQANRPWAEVDARMISDLSGRNDQWWFFHGDVGFGGLFSSDVNQLIFQPGRLGSSFDEIVSLARSSDQRLFVDINNSWVNRPTVGNVLSLRSKLKKLGMEYVFSSTRWDLLDILSPDQRFYTITSAKNLERFITQQETRLIPSRTAVTLKGKLATKTNIQALLKAGVNDICTYVVPDVEQAERVIENGVTCVTTSNLSLIKYP